MKRIAAAGREEDLLLTKIVAEAILSERKRCVAVAEGEARDFDFQRAYARMDDQRAADASTRLQVARDIRAGTPLEELPKRRRKRHFTFELNVELPDDDRDVDDLVERLYEAGLGDALIGSGKPGVLAIDCTRAALDISEVVNSAIDDVKHAIPKSKVKLVPKSS